MQIGKMKKNYKKPIVKPLEASLVVNLMDMSSPENGLHNGGEGDNSDDPDAKAIGMEKDHDNGLW